MMLNIHLIIPINNEYLKLCNHDEQIKLLHEHISEINNLICMVKMLF
jgi:hypothetical protein